MSRRCIFCDIIKRIENGNIYYEDNEVMVIQDIRPAAEYHFLAIPLKHIKNINYLNSEHIGLLKSLKRAAEKVLNEQLLLKYKYLTAVKPSQSGLQIVNVAPTIHALFGFHVPPHNSVGHLHMHIVAPADQLSERSQERVLGQNNFRFRSYEDQLNKLEKNRLSGLKADKKKKTHVQVQNTKYKIVSDVISPHFIQALAVKKIIGRFAQRNTTAMV